MRVCRSTLGGLQAATTSQASRNGGKPHFLSRSIPLSHTVEPSRRIVFGGDAADMSIDGVVAVIDLQSPRHRRGVHLDDRRQKDVVTRNVLRCHRSPSSPGQHEHRTTSPTRWGFSCLVIVAILPTKSSPLQLANVRKFMIGRQSPSLRRQSS